MITISANSSWHWLTKAPQSILHIVIIATLVIETIIIVFANNIKPQGRFKTFIVIAIANVFSYVFPYLGAVFSYEGQQFYGGMGIFEAVDAYVNKMPIYIVGPGLLFFTIIIEIPIIYYSLVSRQQTMNKKRAIASIVVANLVTFLLVFVVERTFFFGSW